MKLSIVDEQVITFRHYKTRENLLLPYITDGYNYLIFMKQFNKTSAFFILFGKNKNILKNINYANKTYTINEKYCSFQGIYAFGLDACYICTEFVCTNTTHDN